MNTASASHGASKRVAGLGQGGRTLRPIATLAFFAAGFLFSTWYLYAHWGGDLTYYTRFYDALYQMPWFHWELLQRRHLGASEPFYRFLIALGAYPGLDRILYLSFWNGLLIASIGYVMMKHRCSLIFAALMLTNYYLIVILGPAERLKFAYLCLVLAFAIDNARVRFALSAASLFFHTQALIQFASAAGYWVISNFRAFAVTPLRTLLVSIAAGLGLGGILYFFYQAVGQTLAFKSSIYLEESGGIAEVVQWIMLLGAGLIVFRRRVAYLAGMLPMSVLTILYGNRVNVATLALFVAVAMAEDKTRNPVVLAVMAYMSFKSIGFMMNVIEYGSGYI